MKKFAVIGNPIEHSLSPALHMEIYNQLNFKAKFFLEKITSNKLDFFIKNNNYDGVNITIPHKENILSLADEIYESARIIGAANTIYFKNGKIIADNTDTFGFYQSLIKNFPNYNFKKQKTQL